MIEHGVWCDLTHEQVQRTLKISKDLDGTETDKSSASTFVAS